MNPEVLRRLLHAQQTGPACVLATKLPEGTQLVLPDAAAPPAVQMAAAEVLARDEPRLLELGAQTWFLHPHGPAPRLLIVGAVHIAQALAPMAAQAGFAATIIDPRRGFATAERFPGATLTHAWPDEALAALAPDARTAIVVLAHDPKIDDPALQAALGTESFYIGALGSRKSHAARLGRLAEAGLDAAALARIKGPVGLPIGAQGAAEIAISIVADIIATKRHAPLAR